METSGLSGAELARMQEEMFASAREKYNAGAEMAKLQEDLLASAGAKQNATALETSAEPADRHGE